MNYKKAFIYFLFFLPFWWGINALASNLEDLWYLKEITQNPNILSARADQSIAQLKLSKVRTAEKIKDRLEDLKIEAQSMIVIEVDADYNAKILLEKKSRDLKSIASITKLMTALVIFDLDETYGQDLTIKISSKAISQDGLSELRTGNVFSVKNLLYRALVKSSNDATFALTQPIGETAFVDLMNIMAEKIGLKDTHFVNVTGLDPDGNEGKNISTARDLSLLAKYILEEHPEIFEITKTQDPQNTNEMLGEYPEIIGGKTGWTPIAGECLIIVSQKPKSQNHYISVVLGANNRFVQMRKILNALK